MEILIAAGMFVLGWLIGSGINYVSDVLPITRRFSPALCPACQAHLGPVDYLLLRACPECGKRRSLRAWIVQILAAAITAWLWFSAPQALGFLPALGLFTYFGVVMVIDIEHRLILHPVSLAGAALGGAIGWWQHGPLPTLLGGLAGFGIMLGLYLFGYLFAKGLGKLRKQTIDEEALGFGDVMLSGVLGLLLGWPGVTVGLLFAILLGGAVSLLVVVYMLLARRYRAFQAIPYGPFLVAAAVIVLMMK